MKEKEEILNRIALLEKAKVIHDINASIQLAMTLEIAVLKWVLEVEHNG